MSKFLTGLLISFALSAGSVRAQEISNSLQQFPECTTEYGASTFLINSSSNEVLRKIKKFQNRFRGAHFCLRDGEVKIWVYQTYKYADKKTRDIFFRVITVPGNNGKPQAWMWRDISTGAGVHVNKITVIILYDPPEYPYQPKQP